MREDPLAAVKCHLKAAGHNPQRGYRWARDAEGLRKHRISADGDSAIDLAGAEGPNRGRRGSSAWLFQEETDQALVGVGCPA
jgi:hypothetical protein